MDYEVDDPLDKAIRDSALEARYPRTRPVYASQPIRSAAAFNVFVVLLIATMISGFVGGVLWSNAASEASKIRRDRSLVLSQVGFGASQLPERMLSDVAAENADAYMREFYHGPAFIVPLVATIGLFLGSTISLVVWRS